MKLYSPLITTTLIFMVILFLFQGCGEETNVITVYTSVDRDYSEDILNGFQEKYPEWELQPVFDTELTKTTGLYTRIQQEASNPQADVFWNNEIVRTIQLKQQDLLQPYHSPAAEDIPEKFKDPEGYWTGFSARARVMIINNDKVPQSETPASLPQLHDNKYKGEVAMALPMFGTTATHMAAYYTLHGETELKHLIQFMKGNDAQLLQGNATVRDKVAQGELAYGLTDTDDVFAILDEDKPVRMAYLDQNNGGTLLIPNTVALIKNAPNPEGGKKLIDYLLSHEVEQNLAESRARQIPIRPDVPRPEGVPDLTKIKTMDVDFEEVAANMKPCMEILRTLIK